MSQVIEFLQPSVNQIRNSIKGIDESYNNQWDILAELLQNSVDAINHESMDGVTEGIISIEINSQDRSICVEDNGCGIALEDIPILLKPFGTNKRNSSRSIGEKGVGLKFVLFQSMYFEMTTGNDSGSSITKVAQASVWKNQTNDDSLFLDLEKSEHIMHGTKIYVSGIDNDDLFSLKTNQLVYILRTKTAVGNTAKIWNGAKKIKVNLIHKDLYGTIANIIIPYKYWLPNEKLDNNTLDLQDFEDWLRASDRSDFDKREKLKDKIIVSKGMYNHNGYRTINYWACFLPNRSAWDQINLSASIIDDTLILNKEWIENNKYVLHHSGILTSVKGMPTGIYVDHPETGFSGYWSNVFIIFEDDLLQFDIGRKSIHGKTQVIYKQYARQIFNNFLKYISKYASGNIDYDRSEFDRNQIISEINQIHDLGDQRVKFMKSPYTQEASVAAIFYELIGNGMIQGITPMISGYTNRYDLYAKINNQIKIMEFKSKLSNIVRDFEDARKKFDEIDYIVCWNISDSDIQNLRDLSIDLNVYTPPLFGPPPTHSIHVTHVIILNGFTKPVYIIDLHKVIFG